MNAIELEVHRHAFASIAEEMGVALMRSAFSPNIKERRDFSCAIFDASAEMVAQAAHIPVHLGSTPMSVAAAIDAVDMNPGDHVVLNDPYAGGTHLPDITVVSPVFDDDGELRFYVANRAHHADVGGISPGSLPLSSSIDEEGIRIPPTVWSEELGEEIADASRTPDERRGDLRAQLAANRRGRQRLREKMGDGRSADAAEALIDYSERFMRRVLGDAPDGSWSFEDAMDSDGHGNGPLPVRCEVTIEGEHARVDFDGTARQTRGPVNVPRSVTISAVLYAFRCLAPPELPSNGGYMRCIDVETQPGTLVDATFPAAVAVGNVETSQRITDVVLGALAEAFPERVPAASCGTMNNVLIGGDDPRTKRRFAYYETIAGGAGAGPGFDGCSAVHTHMTNTLNTPIEALEYVYPFRVEAYRVRSGSGGGGRYRGGEGVRRVYRFEAPATVTLMTERRTSRPYGLRGGGEGEPGMNLLASGREERRLDDKTTFDVEAGDVLIVETPGGGGWGSPADDDAAASGTDET